MGQKVRPTGLRLGITESWRSRWFARKKDFGHYLVEDQKLRGHIKSEFHYAGISKLEIERTGREINIRIHTARPGLIIGRKGAKVDKLREDLAGMTGQEVNINIMEVKRPELDAQLVAESVADQLMKRAPFRRTMKRSIEATMQAGAKGCKLMLAGRLGGGEMSRREHQHQGSIPLHTLRAKIDYGFSVAKTNQGTIGVKCWIYTGLVEEGSRRGFNA